MSQKNWYEKFGKRIFESGIVIPLLIGLFPVFLIGLAISLVQTKGRPFFLQERVNGGNLIRIVKIRTMTSKSGGLDPKSDDDRKLIRFAKVLRRFGFDEYPVLCQILIGRLRLFGPKAALPEEVGEMLTYEWYVKAKKALVSPAFREWRERNYKGIKPKEFAYLSGPITFAKDWAILCDLVAYLFRGEKDNKKSYQLLPIKEGGFLTKKGWVA